jgi:hypothetical protein
MLAAMVPRLITFAVGSLVCSLIVLPMVGDPSWLTWLALLLFTGLGIPLSAWAAVRLLWPATSGAAAWSAVVAALIVQGGLSVGVWIDHALTPRDIGSAIGRLFRGEGMAPGGLSSSRLGSKLAFAWVKPVATEGHDDVQLAAVGDDDLLWLAAERKANPPGRGGELALIGFDERGEAKRTITIARDGEATVLAMTASKQGDVTLVVRNTAQLTIGGTALGVQGREGVLVARVDKEGGLAASFELPLTDAVATSDAGRLWVAGDKQRPLKWGESALEERGLAVFEVTEATGGGKQQVLGSRHAIPSSLHVSGDRIWLTAHLARSGDQLTAGPEVHEVDETPVTTLVTLDKASLDVRSSFKIGDVTVVPAATTATGDGELVLGMTLPLPTAESPPTTPLLDTTVERLGPLSIVLAQVSPIGELRWRTVMGNPKGTTATDDAVAPSLALARDEHGLVLVAGLRNGLIADIAKVPPLPSASGDPFVDAVAVRLSHAGQVAFAHRQGGSEAHERYRAIVPHHKGLFVAGATTGDAELGGFSLPAGEGEAKARGHAFVGLARIE